MPSPSETNSRSATQDVRISLNPKVRCSDNKSLAQVSTLSQMNPVHIPSYFLKIHFNVIIPSMTRSSYTNLICMQYSLPIFSCVT